MTRLTASAARKDFAETINRVAYGGERITIRRGSKDVVAMIPVRDLKLLIRLIEEFRDRSDLRAAREALAEQGENLLYEDVRRELGLSD